MGCMGFMGWMGFMGLRGYKLRVSYFQDLRNLFTVYIYSSIHLPIYPFTYLPLDQM